MHQTQTISQPRANYNTMRKPHPKAQSESGNQPSQAYFQDLEQHLSSHIEKATYVIGCMAWLTNSRILSLLATKSGVKIVVNKEEFLNSDTLAAKSYFSRGLRAQYNGIPAMDMQPLINHPTYKSLFADDTNRADRSGSILTCGIVNNTSKMHHKFLIFMDAKWQMLGVWTGSYNCSCTSNYSLENAVYLTQPNVVYDYLAEFVSVYRMSEPYDWTSGLIAAPGIVRQNLREKSISKIES